MKRALIISPYFPPSNAADMHRVRMSLAYYIEFGWEVEVVTVDQSHSDLIKDDLFRQALPERCVIHCVSALKKSITSKLGLGSIALRSLWFYKRKVDSLLKASHYDLIFFSTTQFPLCVLGAYWNRKFKVPYIIDMQDPWHSEYYRNKPRNERPSKYWFSYRLNKLLEPIAMKYVSGIISVSNAYIENLKERYDSLASIPARTITFGYFEKDLEIARNNSAVIELPFFKSSKFINIVYVGRGGYDMQPATKLLFIAFKRLLEEKVENVQLLRFHFIGTSYAPKSKAVASFSPLAQSLGINEYVSEVTDRITLYETIRALHEADGLFIPGSTDSAYTASKIYPYILAKRPLIAVFKPSSSAFHIIKDLSAGDVTDLNNETVAIQDIQKYLTNVLNKTARVNTNWKDFDKYSARRMTEKQCEFFNIVV